MRHLTTDTMTTAATMPHRYLPGLDRVVSAIGAGCWPLGGPCTNAGVDMGWAPVDADTALTVLRAAYAAGVRLFDTADVYGHGRAERRLGRLLAEVPRDCVVVSSKVGYAAGRGLHPYHPRQMRHRLATTLANLGTHYLDVYAFHSGDFGPNDAYLDDAIAQMYAFRRAGLIRAISMRAPHELAVEWAIAPATPCGRRAARFLHLFERIRPDILAVRHNLLSPTYRPGETDIFTFAHDHGVGVLVKQVLGQGLLVGRHHPDQLPTFGPGDHRTHKPWFTPTGLHLIHDGLRPFRDRFGDTPAALTRVAVRYALQTAPNAAALIGFHTAAQVTAATRLGGPLPPDEIEFVCATGQRLRALLDREFGPTTD